MSQAFYIKSEPEEYVKCEPCVTNDGIYTPIEAYVPKGCMCDYKLVMSKEMFIEAYNKWIKGEEE